MAKLVVLGVGGRGTEATVLLKFAIAAVLLG